MIDNLEAMENNRTIVYIYAQLLMVDDKASDETIDHARSLALTPERIPMARFRPHDLE